MTLRPIEFSIDAKDCEARACTIRTRRSVIETPVFMPVGTQGSVKGVRFEWLEDEIDARILLGNTYHLFLRPGTEAIRHFGGLHSFISWNGSILTDSGGFQVFSLSERRKISEEGVRFSSHLDGSPCFISPEISMEIQAVLGSEIVMAFDECPPGDGGVDATRASMELTLRWAERSKKRFTELQKSGQDSGFMEVEGLSGHQALFGIIQGAGHLGLRSESLERTVEIGFDGYAIGGLSVGEEKSVMYDVLEHTAPKMPSDAPRYLMGVGTPENLLVAIGRGVDMFDCVLPTRNGRTGSAFTSLGRLNIRNARYALDDDPLDPECDCSVCRRHSRGYLRHLYLAGEMAAATLISHHNLAFYATLMRSSRDAIKAGRYSEFARTAIEKLRSTDIGTV